MSITPARILVGSVVLAFATATGCSRQQERPAQPTPPAAPAATTEGPDEPDLGEGVQEPTLGQEGPVAIARLQSAEGHYVTGSIAFVPHGDELQVYVDITGLTPGLHGLHVHEKGDCSAPDFSSAGKHFAPRDQPHGDPHSAEHHAGDLGNVDANEEGQVSMRLVAPDLSIERGAKNSALGRAVVVRADPDDLITQPSGGSGARIACGVIELYQPDQDADEAFEPQAQ